MEKYSTDFLDFSNIRRIFEVWEGGIGSLLKH